MKENEITELESRLREVILNTCNKIGCKDCDLSWGESCSATELDHKILNLRITNQKGVQ